MGKQIIAQDLKKILNNRSIFIYKYEIFSIILLIILCIWLSNLNKFNNAYY